MTDDENEVAYRLTPKGKLIESLTHAGLSYDTACEIAEEHLPSDMRTVPVDLIEDVHYHYASYVAGGRLDNQARHLTELANKVSDLSSWHPGYDMNSGTLPWERDDDA